MNKIFLLFNCPSDQNDKRWLEDVLKEHGCNFEIIETKYYANVMCREGIKGKILYYQRIILHVARAILKSKGGGRYNH